MTGWIVLLGYVLVLNLTGFIRMGLDKRRARKKQRRTPERSLFVLALLGGAAGIGMGMKRFRHKTQKAKFRFGIPLLLVVNILMYTAFILLLASG